MPIAIDGSNLGGAVDGRRGARDAPSVLQRLQPWLRGRGGRVLVVFDGPPRPDLADRYGAAEVRWSGQESADTLLLRLIAAAPADWWVVTNDRALAQRCREAGARSIKVAELLRRVAGAGTPGQKSSSETVDVEFWERFFRGEVQ